LTISSSGVWSGANSTRTGTPAVVGLDTGPYARLYLSNQARLDALPSWLHHDNHHRPHRALDGRSPMQLLNNLPGNHT
jgi:transposase InsO family protein